MMTIKTKPVCCDDFLEVFECLRGMDQFMGCAMNVPPKGWWIEDAGNYLCEHDRIYFDNLDQALSALLSINGDW